MIEESLRQCGLGRSILTDCNGVVLAGNKTLDAAAGLGFDAILEVETDGHELVVVKRRDLDVQRDPQARLLATYDNRAAEVSLHWDPTALLADMAEGVDYSGLFVRGELERLCEGAGVLIPEGLLDAWPDVIPHQRPDSGTVGAAGGGGGTLRVEGLPAASGGATGPSPPQAPPAGMQVESAAPVRFDGQADGAEAFRGTAQEGVSFELATAHTRVTVTLSADGELHFCASRSGMDQEFSLPPESAPQAPAAPPEASPPPARTATQRSALCLKHKPLVICHPRGDHAYFCPACEVQYPGERLCLICGSLRRDDGTCRCRGNNLPRGGK